jgi:hypothetical protein
LAVALNFGLPPLTNEEQVGIVQNAIEAVRAVQEPDEPLEVSSERRIEMWEHELDAALKGLRGAINDDKQFRQVVKSHWEAIWNAWVSIV